ncbi:restriction endonuclease subunit S [Chitinophaga ginsengisegetis]|uniref:restriction endonuclease subunit S n=1 Tax=Chitinophaga ginsengisegetis TaxID=393003 RepID=UPI000DB95672|nr:restriction endonuclease subunit S [Chitinophaga ginsengisegetis]MDR6571254.1 restriction endonuclease S subunit [Chitinophaga ginsengisegetis]MDR6650908.1 restriction endonuclease S subunit [Chitinophaga ginsengisegetis]MDR6657338.1 restriction endonuclease S subunit [Chitinophaga ginsengisegetis]
MNNWKPYLFNDAVECNPKISIKKGEIVENCEMEDIEPNNRFVYPREGKLYKGSNAKFQNGDTVFARITPCLENGKIAQIKGLKENRGIGSTEFLVFRGKKNVSDNDYVYYLSKTNLVRDTAINSMSGASGRQRADINAIKKIDLLLPPFPTQQHIANILSAYDELIETNKQRIKLLQETALELYKEWFVRMRFPGYKQTKFWKGVPENWSICKLSELVKSQYGFTASASSKDIGPKLLRITDIVDSIINWDSVPHCFIPERDQEKYSLKNGDIVVARTGATVGFAKRINKLHPSSVFASYLVRLQAKDPRLNFYLGIMIESNIYKEFIQTVASGAAQPQANAGLMTGFSLLKPTTPLLEKFNSIVEPLFDQQEILQKQITHLREVRDFLLPRLISGKLNVELQKSKTDSIVLTSELPNAGFSEIPKGIAPKSNPYFQRRVLAAYIIDRLKDELTFGHVKLMKLMYLCEHLAVIETVSHYHRDAAGPYDNQMMRSIDSQLKTAQWFSCSKTGNKYSYIPLAKKEEYKIWFAKYYSDKETAIQSLLSVFAKAKTEKAEMVATLYEVWQDLKNKKQIPSDKTIIHEVLNNWHESKRRISEERWIKCLHWMREKAWIN